MKNLTKYLTAFTIGFAASFVGRMAFVSDGWHSYARNEYRRGYRDGVLVVQTEAVQHGHAHWVSDKPEGRVTGIEWHERRLQHSGE